MTVRELIKLLQSIDDEARVVTTDGSEASSIKTSPGQVKIIFSCESENLQKNALKWFEAYQRSI